MTVRRADDNQYTLGTGLSASGSGVLIKGGEYCFFASGTVGGSTISLQALSPDGTSWADVQVFSASAVKSTTLPFVQTQVDLPAGQVRVACTGGTPSGINAYLVGLG